MLPGCTSGTVLGLSLDPNRLSPECKEVVISASCAAVPLPLAAGKGGDCGKVWEHGNLRIIKLHIIMVIVEFYCRS